jgi:heme-degrading monooxygenase HmoA
VHMRVVHLQIHPDKIEEAATLFRTSLLPAVSQLQGFQEAYLAVDRTTGKAIGITVWATEADLEANEASGFFREQLNPLRPLFVHPPEREFFEVVGHA